MSEKSSKFVLLFFVMFVLGSISFAQMRLTTHKAYFPGIAIETGKIFYLLYQSGENLDIWQMNDDGTGVTRLTNDDLIEGQGDIFADSSKFAITKVSSGQDSIYVMNIDGTDSYSIYTTNNYIAQMKVSPDMQKIAFVEVDLQNQSYENIGSLYLIGVNGTGLKSLSTTRIPKYLAGGVKAFDVSGSTLTKNRVVSSQQIAFSTDSQKIAFIDLNYRISVVDINGAEVVQISSISAENIEWTKSNIILFQSYDSDTGMNTLCSINPDGSNYQVLFSTSEYFENYSVSPDESKIVIFMEPEMMQPRDFVIISTSGAFIKQVSAKVDMPFPLPGTWITNIKFFFSDAKNLYTVDISTEPAVVTKITDNTEKPVNYVLDIKGARAIYTPDMRSLRTVSTSGGGDVSIIDLTENQFIAGNPVLSPDGTKVLFTIIDVSTTNPIKLYVKNSDGTGATVTIEENSSGTYYGYKWAPSGSKIMFYSQIEHTMCVINPDGTNRKRIIPEGDWGDYLTFSPDGNEVAFMGYISSVGITGIYKTNLTTYTVIYNDSYYYGINDWKGERILIYRYDMYPTLYVIKQDGTGFRRIDYTNSPDTAELSPDGNKIAYGSINETTGEQAGFCTFSITADETGSGVVKSKLTKDNYTKFSWQPDSIKIAFRDSIRNPQLENISCTNSDGFGKVSFGPYMKFFDTPVSFISSSKISYGAGLDIWTADIGAVPVLSVSVAYLNVGELKAGEKKNLTFEITNTGAGTLTGTISSDKDWILVSPASFSGNTVITVTVDNSVLNKTSGQHLGNITVTSNGGTAVIEVILTATCVLVKPNPYNPASGDLIFYGNGIVPNNTEINIFSLSGEIVRKLKADDKDTVIWDGKDEKGLKVIDGIYIYTYKSPLEKGVGKITVK